MKLGIFIGYSGARIQLPMPLFQMADQAGVHSVWTAEAYGSDAITPLAWIGAQTKNLKLGTAIMQMPARTPANTAMTAMTLDQLSGGRFMLGVGVSGPQVVEGWHGQSYGKPLAKTREYVSILRQIFKREAPLSYEGDYYQIPYAGDDATGLGKPLKSIIHGRPDLPIYLAAIGPKNVELAAEIADGWLPIFFAPRHYNNVFRAPVEKGFAKSGIGKGYDNFEIAAQVAVCVGEDIEACRAAVKPQLALYVGGMGAAGKNFYYDLAVRYGYESAAAEVQALYLAGKKPEAIAAIPDGLVDDVALVGPKSRIREQLKVWQDSPVTLMLATPTKPEDVQALGELLL
jgi:F420-dependent oxidoreductase-like protein